MIKLRLKEIMEEKGMTVKDVAKKYGTQARSITNLINNWSGCYPSMMTLAKLARILDCKVIELIDEDGFYYDAAKEKRLTKMMRHGTKREYTCPYCGGIFDIREVPQRGVRKRMIDDDGFDDGSGDMEYSGL